MTTVASIVVDLLRPRHVEINQFRKLGLVGFASYPRLAPWAAFLRRSAADLGACQRNATRSDAEGWEARKLDSAGLGIRGAVRSAFNPGGDRSIWRRVRSSPLVKRPRVGIPCVVRVRLGPAPFVSQDFCAFAFGVVVFGALVFRIFEFVFRPFANRARGVAPIFFRGAVLFLRLDLRLVDPV